MSVNTTNYGFVKPDPTDIPDITVLSRNWDVVDFTLKLIDDRSKITTVDTANEDINTYTEQGIYLFDSHTPTGVPSGCTKGWLLVIPWKDDYEAVQLWIGRDDSNVDTLYVRNRNYPNWTNWKQICIDVQLDSLKSELQTQIEMNKALVISNEQKIKQLRAAIGSPLQAATVSAMTDTTKIYVYTGSESGYTAGNWYFYNGTAWVSGGVYNSTAVETDKTFSLPDVPADAKATGDELTDLKSAVNDVVEIVGIKADLSNRFSFDDEYRINFQTGKAQYYENYDASASNFVDISLYDTVTVTVRTQSTNGADGIAFYDDTKTYISGERALKDSTGGNIEIKTLTTPDTAKYLRVTWVNSSSSKYSHFSCSGESSGGLNELSKNVEANLSNIADLHDMIGNVKNISSDFNFTNNSRINYQTGEENNYDDYAFSSSGFVNILGFNKIKIAVCTDSSSGASGLAFYDDTKTFISGVQILNTWESGNTFVDIVDIPSNAVYVRTTWVRSDSSKYNKFFCIGITIKEYTKSILQVDDIIPVTGIKQDLSELITFFNNYRINYQTGKAQYYENYDSSATNYIDVTDYDRIVITTSTLSSNGVDGVAFYDSEQKYLSGERILNDTTGGNAAIKKIDVPSEAKYMRSTWVGKSNDNFSSFFCYGYVNGEISNVIKDFDKSLSVYNIPNYYFEDNYLQNRVQKINEIATSLDRNSGRSIFITDYHLETNIRKSPILINYIINKTGIKNVVFGGDAYNKDTSSALGGYNLLCEFVEDFNPLNSISHLFLITGNHEMNDPSASSQSLRLSPDVVYQVFNEPNKLITCLDNTNSFYYDDDACKIRYYYIDCGYDSLITTTTRISMFNSLLDVPEGYAVFIYSHVGTTQTNNVIDGINSRFEQIMQCCTAMNDGVSTTISLGSDLTYDFTGKQRTFIGAITGHLHLDGYAMYDDRFPVIATNSDRINGVRKPNTITEQAFDVVQIDVTNKRIYCTRIGYGQDRIFSFGDSNAGLVSS